MPRVLSVNAGQDLAGTGIRLKRAFDRHSEWTFDSVASSTTYIHYPVDRSWAEAPELWRQADVVHVHNTFATSRILETEPGDKPTVMHHHGTAFREGWTELLRDQRRRRAVGVAATLDLYLMAPDELEWLPAAYDVDWLASLRYPIDDGRIRIATAPTDRIIKSTGAFLDAVRRLSRQYPIELILIERARWETCLARKAIADIFFDQVLLGYGCNAIEAMGMGIPVVAGASPETIAEYRRRFGELPFHESTERSLYKRLRELVAEPELRRDVAERGLAHARRWHDEQSVVRQAEGLYQRAILTT